MSQTKEERLQLRVAPAAKHHLESAAEAAHLNLSSFVLQAAIQRADEILADRALINLKAEAAEAFLDALEAPATVNDRLLDALQRSPKVDWLD
ncbi:type II toxin-antitoxin system TacA family antitoxin [Nocardioides sp. Root140]|uniref:type II toxin-antitoxin system TacA family antitoxin n=1 Tax=Nocardioides sp. Root140 TaxID=1736460 RepID=UPI0006FCAB05|nr:DUF1778 domain-containing protein [Nocardioides sp. Root140]KQY64739.1 hypothetical protein ASD30_07560 [Nocardioides sp. Root140]